MDVTPIIPADRQVIDAYGPGRFRVAGKAYGHALLVFPDRTEAWSAPADAAGLTLDAFAPVLARREEVEVLLVGTGPRMALLPKALRLGLREAGIVADAMDTGAACRTYNVLLGEGRRVAAALLPA
jgi:uncharacterized protein